MFDIKPVRKRHDGVYIVTALIHPPFTHCFLPLNEGNSV